MILKHGVATSDDVSALKEPFSRALTLLSNLSNHMDLFLLASQRLTAHGAAKGRPTSTISSSFLKRCRGPLGRAKYATPGYYAQFPAILQQCVATLFPYLKKMRDHLVRSDPTSPFSGFRRRQRQPSPRPESQKGTKTTRTTPHARQSGQTTNHPSTPALHRLHDGVPTGQSPMLPSPPHPPTTYPTMYVCHVPSRRKSPT
jgi:hypothetical protein